MSIAEPTTSALPASTQKAVDAFMEDVISRSPGETEFHQAAREVANSVMHLIQDSKAYRDAGILARLVVPDNVVAFRVTWVNDGGKVEVNRGYRVRMNGALGPYKGGLRFHPSVNLGVLKFLALEQVLKNSLTTLPLGGGKGGSDFNPDRKSVV